jgi:RNA polymerase sigma factor (sigma-70 family)
MTDLTILIAVIALALWPLAFLVLRIRHERKKRRNRLDRMTKEDLEDIGTEELVIAVLKKIGCQPETNEEGKSYKEIADILQITEEQVKVTLFRARQKIKQRYTEIEDYGL